MKLAALLFAGVALSSILVLRPANAAEPSANECVRMREIPNASSLGLSVDNSCDRKLSCSLTWVVQCESATGKITRTSNGSARFVVDASGSAAATASAGDCGDNWKIKDVVWDCSPAK